MCRAKVRTCHFSPVIIYTVQARGHVSGWKFSTPAGLLCRSLLLSALRVRYGVETLLRSLTDVLHLQVSGKPATPTLARGKQRSRAHAEAHNVCNDELLGTGFGLCS